MKGFTLVLDRDGISGVGWDHVALPKLAVVVAPPLPPIPLPSTGPITSMPSQWLQRVSSLQTPARTARHKKARPYRGIGSGCDHVTLPKLAVVVAPPALHFSLVWRETTTDQQKYGALPMRVRI